MKFAAVFPVNAFANDAVAIRDWAQAAESLGYSRIVGFDHVVGAVHEGRKEPMFGPYSEKDVFHEPLTLFAFLAGGVILNVIKEELPEEQESLFWAFALGAALYTVLLLTL